MILSKTLEERKKHLDSMLAFQQADFLEIFKSFAGKITTVRFIDPPLHEFLPIESDQRFEDDVAVVAEVIQCFNVH
jgi:pyruvate,orthophosphate dikinase